MAKRQARKATLATLDAAVYTLVERLGEPVQAEAQVGERTLRVRLSGNGTIWASRRVGDNSPHTTTSDVAWMLGVAVSDRIWTVTTY